MLDPQTCGQLLEAGHLQPVSTSEDGSRLGFESEHLDEIRRHVVDQTADDAEAGAGTDGNFAAARALLNLHRKSELAAAKHLQLLKFNRLTGQDIEFGALLDALGEGSALVKNFLGTQGATIAAQGLKGAIAGGAVGAGVGAVAGGGKAIVHNVLNPDQPESVIGGALGGAKTGAIVGGIGAVAGPALVENGLTPWWKKVGANPVAQPQGVSMSARPRGMVHFGETYEDIVLNKFTELKAQGIPEVSAKAKAVEFCIKKNRAAYSDYRRRGGQINFETPRQKAITKPSPDDAHTLETRRILAKIAKLHGGKVPLPGSVSM